jgi:hypothetical protein
MSRRRYAPLRYPDDFIFGQLTTDQGARLRKLYRRLFGQEPPKTVRGNPNNPLRSLAGPANAAVMREFELQEFMYARIGRKLVQQEPEFHNPGGRPKGVKDKKPRRVYSAETQEAEINRLRQQRADLIEDINRERSRPTRNPKSKGARRTRTWRGKRESVTEN